jgi:hypothetical protein
MGLWGYNIRIPVQFTSLKPTELLYQANIIFLPLEHVIGKEVESALQEMDGTNVRVNEFTVAPQITLLAVYLTMSGLLEFEQKPENNRSCR